MLWQHKRSSFEEFLFLLLFGLMPVWLGAVINFVSNRSVGEYLVTYLYSGEALLISSATIGPLIFLIFKDYDKRTDGFSKPFPGSRPLGLIILVICLVSASIVGLKSGGRDPTSQSTEALWYVSLTVSIVSVMVWFAVIILKNSLETAATQVMRQDTNDFVQDWQNS